MRGLPSPPLVELLAQLRLATSAQLHGVAGRVRKLAGEFPQFDSVWVDALAQARLLTPYQAAELNVGRGDDLAVGPYIVTSREPSAGFANSYRAIHRETGQPAQLLAVELNPRDVDHARKQLTNLLDRSDLITSRHLRPIVDFHFENSRAWLVAESVTGKSAADWLVENGRFPPLVALAIARQMTAGLCDLEQLDMLHGDLHVRDLTLTADGTVVISHPGVRPIVRPSEGFSQADLPSEAYESIAPERIVDGVPHDLASELFSCGCVWWQLLTGRPAIVGGNSLAKLRAAAEARIPDVRQFAPDAPPILAEVIAACVSRNPADRPRSLAEVADLLGPPSKSSAQSIVRCLDHPDQWLMPRTRPKRQSGSIKKRLTEVVAVGVCVAIVLGGWWMSRRSAPRDRRLPAIAATTTLPPIKPVEDKKSEVVAASYHEKPKPPRTRKKRELPPLVLPVGRVVHLDRIAPKAGQTVCGTNNQRVKIAVPAAGLLITEPDVRFQNIDFIRIKPADAVAAFVQLQAASCTFVGCSIQSASNVEPSSAIAWQPVDANEDSWYATSDSLQLINCVFSHVATVVERHRAGEVEIVASNVLHVASGPFLRMARPLGADEPLSLSLNRCTLRDSSGVIEIAAVTAAETRTSRINIRADNCVFQPSGGPSLVKFRSEEEPELRPGVVRWSGEGSLVAVETPLVGWLQDQDRETPLEEAVIEVSGLVRSQMQFVGDDVTSPADSKLSRWLGPRQSPFAPGIDPNKLNLPIVPTVR